MIISHRLLAMTTSLLMLVGCVGAQKPVSQEVPTKQPYLEYTYLDGMGSDKSPAADRLRQAGWVFIGYNRMSYGGINAIDEKSEAAKQIAITQQINSAPGPRDFMRATFRRECK
jgi:hypothetical protein